MSFFENGTEYSLPEFRPFAEPYRSGTFKQIFDVYMNGYNTPPEYLEYIHPHWLQYEAPNPFLHHMLAVFYIIFMFGSLCGNGVVLWIFSTCKALRSPSNYFVMNLALLDFLMMSKTPVFIVNSFNEGPIWGKAGCDIYGIIGSISGIGSAMTNTAIAFDRYRTISNPLSGKLSSGKALGLVLLIWIWALPFTIMPALEIWGRFVPEGYLTSCTFDYLTETSSNKMFVACIFFYSYCIPISMTIYFYSKILGHVREHENLLREQAKRMNVESLRGNKEQNDTSAEIRIAKVAIGITCLFILSWTPYAIVALIACFGNRNLITPLVSMVPACTCKAVACLDPWVYAINHPKYRLELQKRMPWFCIHEPIPAPAENASVATKKSTVA